jgi:nitronate monooxygenase
MIRTRLTERFNLKHPIVCAPMALVTGGRLAAAVSDAGGLGVLGGGYAGTLGGEPDLATEYRNAGNAAVGIGFITWAAQQAPQLIDWVIARRPACLFLSFGDPAAIARKALDAGIPVLCQVQTMRHVEEALAAGAAGIIAQGTEAGGHGARRSTLPFVPEVVDLVSRRSPETLVLAAGGIADGRGLAAALMLGADGVVVGSRFWASTEALTHPEAIARAITANGDQTVRTTAIDSLRGVGWPREFSFRMLRNRLTEEWAGREEEARERFGEMARAYDEARRKGDFDIVASVVGEGVGLITDRRPARRIVVDMVAAAEEHLRRGARLIGSDASVP